MTKAPPDRLTFAQLQAARRVFEANEPRDLFYRAASELVSLALRGQTSLTVGEGLAVLLQTWNKNFYRFTRFDKKHYSDIERLLRKHRNVLSTFRNRVIVTFRSKDWSAIETLFADFELVLGPVGAAKSLHLLAPFFFPLWDRKIAQSHCGQLGKRGSNAYRYLRFMRTVQEQCGNLRSRRRPNWNPLKGIDEYNYCLAKGWILEGPRGRIQKKRKA